MKTKQRTHEHLREKENCLETARKVDNIRGRRLKGERKENEVLQMTRKGAKLSGK